MAHEIVRQAVLLAVRDAGAQVRDGSVNDVVPAGDAPADLEVDSFFALGWVPVAILAKRTPTGRDVLATFELGKPMPKFIDYVVLVERAEALSRSEKGFPGVLVKSGLSVVPDVPKQEPAIDKDVERRLSRITFTESFAAVRLLHNAIREKGASPDRLGALARGYATLGALTDFHWNSGSKALKARGLLVAQRMVARDPHSPVAFWHRAYARGLVGFHKDALDDLATAATLAKERTPAEAAPSWVPLVDALCRFQTEKLLAARSGADGRLAMFLAFLTAEDTDVSMARAATIGQELLQDNPECYRVHDRLCRYAAVGLGHQATLIAMQAFSEGAPTRLKDLPGVPGPVADAGGEVEVARALIEAGKGRDDQSEPSWSSLGRMLRDVRFAQVIRRAHFMKCVWNVLADDFVAQARPLVIDHPYLPLLDSYAVDPRREADKYGGLLKQVNIPDLDFAEDRFVQAVSDSDMARHVYLLNKMICHGDTFYHDLADMSRWLKAEAIPTASRHILEVSPYAPIARARLVDHDWTYAKPHAKDWEADAADQPDVLAALGRRYNALKQWDAAERCLTKAVALAPDVTIFRLLAQAYEGRGDLERWEATLKRGLDATDLGLGHMQVETDLAYFYIKAKQYDKALPYAEAAAATWAGNGMHCAAVCHEHMKNWEQAELWTRRITERYPNTDWLDWFSWCRRTGHGDVASARATALHHIESFGENPPETLREWVATFHIIDGSPKKALAIMVPVQEKDPNALRGIFIATLADEIGDSSGRDHALSFLEGQPQVRDLKFGNLVKAIRSGLANPDGRIDQVAVTAALNAIPESHRYIAAIFVAQMLYRHGATEKAISLVRQCIEPLGNVGWAQAVASQTLRNWESRPEGTAPAQAR